MRKNKQATRAFIAFLVTWSFVLLTVTGLVLYVVPHGRVVNWTFWSLAGLAKDGWADLHILFGVVFIVAGALHLYFNWKPFKGYLAERVLGHLALKRELVTSLGATALLAVGAIYALPPVSWVFDLNDAVKSYWGRIPGQEPPYPRAEEAPLPVLAKRLDLDLDALLAQLESSGIRVPDSGSSLADIARPNGTTPASLFALASTSSRQRASAAAPTQPAPRDITSPELSAPGTAETDTLDIEARLTGTGVGAKTLANFADQNQITVAMAQERLAALGIKADPGDTLKALAARHATRPIEIAKALLSPGYRPVAAE
jgi:hypothetical protein